MSSVAEVVNRCLALGDEPEWFEYKQGTAVSKPDEVGEYISALSNAAVIAGEPYGYLIWGINNTSHEIVGTDFNIKEMLERTEEITRTGKPAQNRFSTTSAEAYRLQSAFGLMKMNWKGNV